jgi:small subunit ribosomal protein S16
VGSKKNAMWRVVVADQRSPRDGRFIEMIGHYNPHTQPSQIVIDRERLDHWISMGAEPSDTVRKLMRAPNSQPNAPAQAEAPVAEAAPPSEGAETPPSEGTGTPPLSEGTGDAEGAGPAEPAADTEAAASGEGNPDADASPEAAADTSSEDTGEAAPEADAKSG